MNSNIQSSVLDLGRAISTGIGYSADGILMETRITHIELLDTLHLIYSDLFNELVKDPTHKLFYLKSKIDSLVGNQNAAALTSAQFNYLTILESELAKLNEEHKLLERG